MPNQETATLTLRLNKDLRKSFLQTCEDNDTTASREIRQFMRKFIAQNGQKKLL